MSSDNVDNLNKRRLANRPDRLGGAGRTKEATPTSTISRRGSRNVRGSRKWLVPTLMSVVWAATTLLFSGALSASRERSAVGTRWRGHTGDVRRTPTAIGPVPATSSSEAMYSVRQSALASRLAVVLAFALVLGTFLFRAVNLGVSWDIYVDEVSYLRLAEGVADRLQVFLYGQPFFLHPPAFFIVEAAYLKVFPPEGNAISQVYGARYLNAGLAALSVLAVLIIGRTLGGWRVGVLSAAIFALDPFVIRLNSRNYIETSAMLWVLIGYAVLMPAVQGPRQAVAPWRQLLAGLAFGLALLSKDMTAFLTLLPLAAVFVLHWALPRRAAVGVASVTLLTYLPYPLIVIASGYGTAFFEQKFRGLLRLAGVIKETGFKRPGGPSFVEAVFSNLSQLASTYALLVLGLIAIVILYRHRNAAHRLLLTWVASAYGLIGFALVFGTLEEQFFYFVVVPAIPAVVVAGAFVVAEARTQTWSRAAAVTLVAFFAWSSAVWVWVHFTPDNNFERVERFLQREIPRTDRIAVVNDGAQFALEGENRAYMTTMSQFRARQPDYAVVNLKLVRGYSDVEPEVVDFVTSKGTPVYSFTGRSAGEIVVYRLPPVP